MTVWFTSDLHLGHARIVDLSHRPFGSIEEHDQSIADRWKSCVLPDDIVWVLGDIAVESTWKHALEVIESLPGRKRLILGNHDQAWMGKSDWMRFFPEYLKVFEAVTPWARTKIQGIKVNLSHFPYEGDHTEGSRFDEYRLRLTENSKPLIHGHIHATDVVKSMVWGAIPQIHVGVDAWGFSPVSDQVVADLLQTGN